MVFAVIEFSSLVPLAVFGAVSALAWLAVDWVWGQKRPAEERLDRLQQLGRASSHAPETAADRVSTAVSAFFRKAAPRLAKPLQPKDAKQASQLKMRLAHAGFRSENAVAVFLGLKVFLAATGFLVAGGTMLFTLGFHQATLLRIITVAGCAFFAPDLVVYMITKRRQQAIFLALPDVLDLIVVCVEAGLGLDQAMAKAADEMQKCYPLLAQEFRITNMHMHMGMSRTEALRDLDERNGEEDLKTLTSALIQASKFGSGIGQALRVQSDAMRTRRRQLAEERASKCAVKLVFPLVLFIFPGIFVALVGPAAVNIANNLLPKMGGG